MPDLAGAEEASPDLLFARALLIPGMLHILHTAAGEITAALAFFATYLADLRIVVDFLSMQWMRERFLATCLNHDDAVGYKHLFEACGKLSLAEWRWGSLFHCVCEVLLRRVALFMFWDNNKNAFC